MDAILLLQKIRDREITPVQAVNDAIAKIEKENPRINAAVEVLKSEAVAGAMQPGDGPLAGLPISVKECYAIAGKSITSGSQRMKPIECSEDSAVVRKLKNAGAVIVSRGNTSEFLLGRETDNLRYGATHSAVNASLTSGGSSGGEGALVGSGCVTVGIGTDIGGSCRYPAAFNGVTGFKPASGQIDKAGIFPTAGNEFTETMNSPGILCKSVRDARLVYNVLTDKKLSATLNRDEARILTSTKFRVKISDTSISNALNGATTIFKSAFKHVIDIEIPEAGELYILFNTLIFAGFSDKIYEWSVTKEGRRLSYFGELFGRIFGKATLSRELFALLPAFNLYRPSAKKTEQAIERVKELRDKYYGVLAENAVLMLPTLGTLAPHNNKFYPQYNKPGIADVITPVSFCNVLNLSCITLPAWKFQKSKDATPPAVMLAAAPGNEELLLNVAELLEPGICNS